MLNETNIEALAARPCISPYFRYRNVKGQLPAFVKLRQTCTYQGPVAVQVPGCEPFTMYSDNDDNVALTHFYYGEGSYESLSTILFGLLARRTRNVLDVGGHTGIFSLTAVAANPNAHVHYFELMPLVAERAGINCKISRFDNRVTINNIGMSREPGTRVVHFNNLQPLWTGASLEDVHFRTDRKGMERQKIEVTTLDSYWVEKDRPDFGLMKIDVENHELAVFDGAQKMLCSCKPFMLCEVLSREQFADFVEVLTGFGLKGIYVIDDDALTLREVDDTLKYNNGEYYQFKNFHNVLFAPNKMHPMFFNQLRQVVALSKLGVSQSAVTW